MFEYTASTIAFAHQPLEEAFDRIARLGLKKVDLWSVKGICEQLPPDDVKWDLARIRRALAASGLSLHALSVYHVSEEIAQARLLRLFDLQCRIRDALRRSLEERQKMKANPKDPYSRAWQLAVDRAKAKREARQKDENDFGSFSHWSNQPRNLRERLSQAELFSTTAQLIENTLNR